MQYSSNWGGCHFKNVYTKISLVEIIAEMPQNPPPPIPEKEKAVANE